MGEWLNNFFSWMPLGMSGTVGWARAAKPGRLGSIPGRDIPESKFVLGVDGWVQGNGSRVALPLARHQCSIHCESRHVAQGLVAPGAKSKFGIAPPCSKLRCFGSKCSVVKKVLVTLLGLSGAPRGHSAPPQWFGASIVTRSPGNYAPLAPLPTAQASGNGNSWVFI